jgi:small neutral amino acid transporter SnatA (MarC family)
MDAPLDVYVLIDIFLLLLIGVGPKIALVPFLEVTAGMDAATRARVTRTMLTTAGVVALILIVLGELLRKLLHFLDRSALDRRRHHPPHHRGGDDPGAGGT